MNLPETVDKAMMFLMSGWGVAGFGIGVYYIVRAVAVFLGGKDR